MPFWRMFFNTVLYAGCVTAGQVFFCSLAGYAFARLDFRGRDTLFLLYLGTLMVPLTVTVIPQFIVMRTLGWVDTPWAMIVPGLFGSAFGTYLMRQFFRTLPIDLEEAAILDGCSPWQIYWRILLPHARPAVMVLGSADLGQRMERLSVATADDSTQQPGHLDPWPGPAAGRIRRPVAGADGDLDVDPDTAGPRLRGRTAFVCPRYRRDRSGRVAAVASVSFEQATRRYPGTDRPALDGLDLVVGDGEFVVMVGPSGCGKTTSLRMVAGLETLDSGVIRIGDRDVTNVDPKDRDVAMVFQNYALYPHMTVAQNMGFALKVAKIPKSEIRERVLAAAKMLDLERYLDRKPKDLSGGQRQRVAMGRAIVRRPQVFLMDEPLSNLDAKLRVQTRNQIAALQRQLGTTTVYVTHDQVEAMTMGDRVAVLCDGVLQQCATPRELYRNPGNVFVAGFIGSPAMNLFTVPIVDSAVSLGDWIIQVPREIAGSASEIVVGVRPEHFELGSVGIEMEIDVVEELGADAYLYGRITGTDNVISKPIIARTDGYDPPGKGSRVRLHPQPGHLHFFGADGLRIR